jgi:hypothetical protein
MKKINTIKYIILVSICILLSLNASSQSINWGSQNVSEFLTSQFLPDVLGEDEDNFYTFTKHGYSGTFAIEAFNKTTKKQLYFQKYNVQKKDKIIWVKKAVLINEKIIVFITEFSNSNNKIELYAAVYNPKTGAIEKDRLDLFSHIAKKNYERSGRFKTYTSPDNSKILINYYAYDEAKNKFYDKYTLLDEKLEQIVSRENAYDGERGDGGSHYTIDNDGNLYFVKNVGFNNYIVSYDVENDYEKWEEQINLSNLDLKVNSVITNLKLNINQNNELSIYGVYSKNSNKAYKGQQGAFDGYIRFKIDPKSKEIIQEDLILLEESLVSEIKSNMGKKSLYFNLNILNLDNGETILTSEFNLTLYTSAGKQIARCYDIVVSKISTSGKLSWSLRIPKRQKYTAPNLQIPAYYKPFYKYTTFTDLNSAYILFNDNPKNIFTSQNSNELKTMGNPKKSKISVYSIDLKTGGFNTNSIKYNEDDKLAIMAPLSFQKKQNSNAYLFKKHGKKYTYGIFSK